jgi:hypothetical protein
LFIFEQKNTINIIRLWDEPFLLVLSSTLSAAKAIWPLRDYESTKHCPLSVAECVCVHKKNALRSASLPELEEGV